MNARVARFTDTREALGCSDDPGSCLRGRKRARSTRNPDMSCTDRSGTRSRERSRGRTCRVSPARRRCTCRRGAACSRRWCDNLRRRTWRCTPRALPTERTWTRSPLPVRSCSRRRPYNRRSGRCSRWARRHRTRGPSSDWRCSARPCHPPTALGRTSLPADAGRRRTLAHDGAGRVRGAGGLDGSVALP